MAHEKWQEETIKKLIELGIDGEEAQRSTKWVLDHLPEGEDPATYIFSAEELYEAPQTPEQITDSRADWYASDSVTPRFKRILDAKTEEEGGEGNA